MDKQIFLFKNISKSFNNLMDRVFTLQAIGVKKIFKDLAVLKDISVTFQKGKTYALMGQSGSGKSTFMHILAGFDVPSEGAVLYNENVLQNISVAERAAKIGFVVQSPLLISELTVYENVILPAKIQGIIEQEYKKRALVFLDAVGLLHTQNWHIGQLSGGQKQRIALVRSLITQPDFLLADELTGNLDSHTSGQLITLLLELQKKWNMGLIISSHSSEIVAHMEVVFTLKDGILISTL